MHLKPADTIGKSYRVFLGRGCKGREAGEIEDGAGKGRLPGRWKGEKEAERRERLEGFQRRKRRNSERTGN